MTRWHRSDSEILGLLVGWMSGQRWFMGKGRETSSVTVRALRPLTDGDPDVAQVLLDVAYAEGPGQTYQMLVGSSAEALPDAVPAAALIGSTDGRSFYDALYDPRLVHDVVALIDAGRTVQELRFAAEPGRAIDPGLPSAVSRAQQSNTSVILGRTAILKLIRVVEPGLNPDLELVRVLASQGSRHVAAPLAAVEGPLAPGAPADTTYAVAQEFLDGAEEGWDLATATVRRLYAGHGPRRAGPTVAGAAAVTVDAAEAALEFVSESYLLGEATANVHRDLVAGRGSSELSPDDVRATIRRMSEHLALAMRIVPEIVALGGHVQKVYDEAARSVATRPATVHRIHGDLHLGQCLRLPRGWVLIDFEGEPGTPLDLRRRPGLPARDVAGMLRSYDYAARHVLIEAGTEWGRSVASDEWVRRNREAYLDGYAAVAGVDPREDPMLRLVELDKAVYECIYEKRNRPTWLPIPLSSLERMVS